MGRDGRGEVGSISRRGAVESSFFGVRAASGIPRDAAFAKPEKRFHTCFLALLVTALTIFFTLFVSHLNFRLVHALQTAQEKVNYSLES
jgi:hypothetical protein